jgi:hypothetical protein
MLPDFKVWNTGIPPDRPGVYAFLSPDDELASEALYIGSTESLSQRYYTHKVNPWYYYTFRLLKRKEPVFVWIEIPEEDLAENESRLIETWQPVLNRRVPRARALRHTSSYAKELQDRVLGELKAKPMTRNDLCKALGENYRRVDNTLAKLKQQAKAAPKTRGVWGAL